MPDQLPIPGVSPNSGSKRCWGCMAEIPYQFGFCEKCWSDLPPEVQTIYNLAVPLPPPWSSSFNEAILKALGQTRRKPRHVPFSEVGKNLNVPTPKHKVPLSDIDI